MQDGRQGAHLVGSNPRAEWWRRGMWDTRPRYFCLKSLYFQREMEKQLFFSVLTQMLYRKEKHHSSESTELLLGEGGERVRKRLSGKFLKMGSPQFFRTVQWPLWRNGQSDFTLQTRQGEGCNLVAGTKFRNCINGSPGTCWALMNIPVHFGIYSFINLVPGVFPWDYLGKEEAMGRGCSWSFIFLRWLYLLGKWPQAWHDSEFWERTRQPLIGKWWLIITQQTCRKNRAWGTPAHILNTSFMQVLPSR